jgi:uncharacterized phage protein (TIGR02218 family)
MKTLNAGLQAHLDSGATTMAYCWRVTRRDGVVLGFTDHDNNLTFLGTTFQASSGFEATQIQSSLGLSVDNVDVSGGFDSAAITEADLNAGRYDDAGIEIYWVNWTDVTQRTLLMTGSIGEVRQSGVAFTAELRSLAHRLNQKVGRAYQRTCDAVFGDARCGVNKASYTYAGTVTSSASARSIKASGLSALATDWLSRGVLTWTSGPNAGQSFDVKIHTNPDIVELWTPCPFPPAVGHTFNIVAGCKQDLATCRDKYNNVANFQGFPHMPGNDVIQKYPNQGGANQSGGSVVK